MQNGYEFGIRIAGMGDEWFTGPVNTPQGLYFTGYDGEDACPDMGDSAITETFGVGGMAMIAAPAVTRFVGAGGYEDALRTSNEMRRSSLTETRLYGSDLELPGNLPWHRRKKSGRERHYACDQHRYRAQDRRIRTDRRRYGSSSDRVLRESDHSIRKEAWLRSRIESDGGQGYGKKESCHCIRRKCSGK